MLMIVFIIIAVGVTLIVVKGKSPRKKSFREVDFNYRPYVGEGRYLKSSGMFRRI